jgi:hypothetical protein
MITEEEVPACASGQFSATFRVIERRDCRSSNQGNLFIFSSFARIVGGRYGSPWMTGSVPPAICAYFAKPGAILLNSGKTVPEYR